MQPLHIHVVGKVLVNEPDYPFPVATLQCSLPELCPQVLDKFLAPVRTVPFSCKPILYSKCLFNSSKKTAPAFGVIPVGVYDLDLTMIREVFSHKLRDLKK